MRREAVPRGALAGEGQAALARGDWEVAVRLLAEAVEAAPGDPECWEALAAAHGWMQRAEPAIEARERAYALFRDRGDDAGAARVCVDLAYDHSERGETAVANGWFQRARRLVRDLPPSRERALVGIWDAYLVLGTGGDPRIAQAHAAEAAAAAAAVAASDVGCLAIALEGASLVSAGRVAEGMDLLDEAVTGALAGEITDPQWFYFSCCCLIDACDSVRDYGRSLEWCGRLREFCRRWRVPAFLTRCRVKYTAALLWRGDWASCEEELRSAMAELAPTPGPALVGATVRLAELRRRQGRFDEAAALLEPAGGYPPALAVRAALALDAGAAEEALELAESLLRVTAPAARAERIGALELRARSLVALGRPAEAAESVRELQEAADRIGTGPVRAAALAAEGVMAARLGDPGRARGCLEDAVRLLDAGGAEYEAARLRLELAECQAAAGRDEAAIREVRAATAVLERVGASADAARARGLLGRLRPAAGSPLTPRQRQILRLVADGLSDRAIASRLFLSEHTVHRHIGNVMLRLAVPTRAAAVARALSDGLL